MTAITDIKAVTPTAASKVAVSARGANITNLMSQLQQHAAEMLMLTKQIIALYPNDSVLSATVNAGGSGGTNGAVTVTGTTGVGTRFTAKGTISGGALSGALTIVNVGSYTTDPTSLSAEPVTGGNLSGATVSLTMSNDNAVLTSLSAILAELM